MTIKDYHEQQFFNALNDIFVGAKIEGESGYINLMAIKSRYYTQGVFPQLKKDIAAALVDFPDFREELFDKLYSFFQRYFSESGSIYFRHTPLHQNVYEKVYTDDRDVVLFWKTHMLYYVKTDLLFKSMAVEVDEQKFWFDASQVELKKSNEKREVVFAYCEKRADGTLVFEVSYSERGSKTKEEDILKALKKDGLDLSDEILNKAFRVFEKQSEVDFFINKDARSFLREQFDLWMYQYLFEGQNVWSEQRLAQLQALKDIAYKVIDFISQFEDELVKIWNKPKFVRNSHYVITFDKLAGSPVVEKLLAHPNMPQQVQEWRELGMIGEDFRLEMLTQKDLTGAPLHPQYQHLPIDTKYFTDLELDILALFDDLDAALDGWLIKSENYQALNTLLPKFREKVQTIYIDPPFNLDSSDQFMYRTNYKDANWATLLENRLKLAKDVLDKKGSIFLRCDHNGNHIVKFLLDEIFEKDNFRNEMILKKTAGMPKRETKNMEMETEYLLYYANNYENLYFNQLWEDRKPEWMPVMIKFNRGGPTGKPIIYKENKYFPPDGYSWAIGNDIAQNLFKLGRMRIVDGKPQILIDKKTVGSNWTDIPGYSSPSRWGFSTENHEKLLKRTVETSSQEKELVMDFFLGSGTTTAVAHKLGRKWVGIEMGNHFYSFNDKKSILSGIVVRMKEVLAGQGNHEPCGISKDLKWLGGGFFKYYELEQYEDVLRRAHYADADLFYNPFEDPYHSYVFLRDLKMLESLEIDEDNNRVRFHPERLYPDPSKPYGTSIDLAETLSHLTGKWIKRITKEYVEFEDGEQMSLTNPDWQVLKPMIWWQ